MSLEGFRFPCAFQIFPSYLPAVPHKDFQFPDALPK